MEAGTLEELKEEFLVKIGNLHACLSWRDASEDESCIAELKDINENVNTMVGMICELKAAKKECELKLGEIKVQQSSKLFLNIMELGCSLCMISFAYDPKSMEGNKLTSETANVLDHVIPNGYLKTMTFNEELSKMEEKMRYMLRNIPERMSKKLKEKQLEQTQVKTSTREPLTQITGSRKSQDNIPKGTKVTQGVKPSSGKQENVYVPEIDFLTVDEFEQIPKYQKGRLTYDQLNKFIEGFNEAFKGKYKIMKQKKSTLKDADRKRYEAYKSQENKDCKGCYFVVDEDLKDFGGIKLDSTARAMCTVLRHCGRIKEIRGGNLTRYKYVDSY